MRVTFDEVTLDTDTRQVFVGAQEVRISTKALDLLTLLVESRPRALAKQILIERLWPGIYVSETSLATLIREIRGGLGDSARHPRFIRTVHRFGYAFCASVPNAPGQSVSRTGLGYWLTWEARQIPLHSGENILGREPDAAVWLDSATVSRQHARIMISEHRATLEDLGSKNGTYVRGARVTGLFGLVDGDEIHLGSLVLRFRMPSEAGSTATQDGRSGS